jgi:predicted acylesterase/phospholipase RssA
VPQRDLALTFAGGGNRAFYQLGLLLAWGDRLLPRTRVIAACSAGACVAVTYLAGRHEEAHRFWLGRRDGITRNFDWAKLLRGQRPAPQGEIYRETLLHTLADGGLERVRATPFPVLVLAARFPRLLPGGAALLLGIGAYQLEKALRKSMVHPALGRAIGFTPALFDARECESAEELAALVLASSATPPFTPVGSFRGARFLDGGMVDNAPAFAAEGVAGVERNLVLLTRVYPHALVGRQGRRLYVAPTVPPPVGRWDYTRPELLARTIELGQAEAEVHEAALAAFLGGALGRGDGGARPGC